MMINLKLSKVDEAKMREVMKKQRRPFTQMDVKRFFLDQINRAYISWSRVYKTTNFPNLQSVTAERKKIRSKKSLSEGRINNDVGGYRIFPPQLRKWMKCLTDKTRPIFYFFYWSCFFMDGNILARDLVMP